MSRGLVFAIVAGSVAASVVACGAKPLPGEAQLTTDASPGYAAQPYDAGPVDYVDAETFIPDATAFTTDGKPCPGYDLCFGLSSGTVALAEHVSLPGVPPKGAKVVLAFESASPHGGGVSIAGFTITVPLVDGSGEPGVPGERTLDVLFAPAYPDDYRVSVGVSTNGDDDADDPGDWFGFAQGTVDAPVQSRPDAAIVPLSRNLSVSYGIGVRP